MFQFMQKLNTYKDKSDFQQKEEDNTTNLNITDTISRLLKICPIYFYIILMVSSY